MWLERVTRLERSSYLFGSPDLCVATREDIDETLRIGMNHPVGSPSTRYILLFSSSTPRLCSKCSRLSNELTRCNKRSKLLITVSSSSSQLNRCTCSYSLLTGPLSHMPNL